MKKAFLILTLLAIISCMQMNHEMKQRRRNGFRQRLDTSRIFKKGQTKEWNLNY